MRIGVYLFKFDKPSNFCYNKSWNWIFDNKFKNDVVESNIYVYLCIKWSWIKISPKIWVSYEIGRWMNVFFFQYDASFILQLWPFSAICRWEPADFLANDWCKRFERHQLSIISMFTAEKFKTFLQLYHNCTGMDFDGGTLYTRVCKNRINKNKLKKKLIHLWFCIE